jgi:hypothetical protein
LIAVFQRTGRKVPVSSLEGAARMWCAYRERSMAGVSQIGNGVRVLTASGEFVGRVSYNGRIWQDDEA